MVCMEYRYDRNGGTDNPHYGGTDPSSLYALIRYKYNMSITNVKSMMNVNSKIFNILFGNFMDIILSY